jgi:hypothetical protein
MPQSFAEDERVAAEDDGDVVMPQSSPPLVTDRSKRYGTRLRPPLMRDGAYEYLHSPDAGFDSKSEREVSDASPGSDTDEATPDMCMTTTCYGTKIELPTDGGWRWVGYDGGGGGYCPNSCPPPGFCGNLDGSPPYVTACWCQCVWMDGFTGPMPSCGGCFCGDSGIVLNQDGNPVSCTS